MSNTAERTWANAHSEGRIEVDPGPVMYLWNFDINSAEPKQVHRLFIDSRAFTAFLLTQIHQGRRIGVIGTASLSGSVELNRGLSTRRAANIRQLVIDRLRALRRRRDISPTIADRDLDRIVIAAGYGEASDYLYRSSGSLNIPVLDEGGQYAFNRGVSIRPYQTGGTLEDHRVEAIGRAYLRRRFPRLPQNFRFWEMWTPTTDVIVQIVPRTLSESNPRRGSRVPPNRPWGNFRPGSRAMTEAGFVVGEFITLRWQLRNFQYNEREVRRQIDSFIGTAESARSRSQQLEQHIARWLDRTAAAGGGSAIIPDMRRYLAFRNPVFLGDQTCMLKYNGFRPVQFRLPPPT